MYFFDDFWYKMTSFLEGNFLYRAKISLGSEILSMEKKFQKRKSFMENPL